MGEAGQHERGAFEFLATLAPAGKSRLLLIEIDHGLNGFVLKPLKVGALLRSAHRPKHTHTFGRTTGEVDGSQPVGLSGILNQFGFSIRRKAIEQMLKCVVSDYSFQAQSFGPFTRPIPGLFIPVGVVFSLRHFQVILELLQFLNE